jgi:hypothetical protein
MVRLVAMQHHSTRSIQNTKVRRTHVETICIPVLFTPFQSCCVHIAYLWKPEEVQHLLEVAGGTGLLD